MRRMISGERREACFRSGVLRKVSDCWIILGLACSL